MSRMQKWKLSLLCKELNLYVRHRSLQYDCRNLWFDENSQWCGLCKLLNNRKVCQIVKYLRNWVSVLCELVGNFLTFFFLESLLVFSQPEPINMGISDCVSPRAEIVAQVNEADTVSSSVGPQPVQVFSQPDQVLPLYGQSCSQPVQAFSQSALVGTAQALQTASSQSFDEETRGKCFTHRIIFFFF